MSFEERLEAIRLVDFRATVSGPNEEDWQATGAFDLDVMLPILESGGSELTVIPFPRS